MPDHRGSRFALEVLFLLALAVGLTLADLQPLEIGGIMLLGWVIVAALEWAAWRDEPHYGSGLPPRYYVPRSTCRRRGRSSRCSAGLPRGAARRSSDLDRLGRAPRRDARRMAAQRSRSRTREPDEQEEAAAGRAARLAAAALVDVEPLPVPTPSRSRSPSRNRSRRAVAPDAWVAPELPAVRADEPDDATEDSTATGRAGRRRARPALHDVALARSQQATARYSLDPLAEPPAKRRFGRGGTPEPLPVVEVPARPNGVRPLPGRPTRQD